MLNYNGKKYRNLEEQVIANAQADKMLEQYNIEFQAKIAEINAMQAKIQEDYETGIDTLNQKIQELKSQIGTIDTTKVVTTNTAQQITGLKEFMQTGDDVYTGQLRASRQGANNYVYYGADNMFWVNGENSRRIDFLRTSENGIVTNKELNTSINNAAKATYQITEFGFRKVNGVYNITVSPTNVSGLTLYGKYYDLRSEVSGTASACGKMYFGATSASISSIVTTVKFLTTTVAYNHKFLEFNYQSLVDALVALGGNAVGNLQNTKTEIRINNFSFCSTDIASQYGKVPFQNNVGFSIAIIDTDNSESIHIAPQSLVIEASIGLWPI